MSLRMRAIALVLPAIASVAACGGTPSPTATPAHTPQQSAIAGGGPAIAFPDADTPLSGVSAVLQQYWRSYDVVVVPGKTALTQLPVPPRVVNDTTMPDVLAQRMGAAYVREQGWRRWAVRESQGAFLQHLGGDAFDEDQQLLRGYQVQLPDCGLFPSSIAVVPTTGVNLGNTQQQYAIEATFSGPCQVQSTDVSGATTDLGSFSGPVTYLFAGWLTSDPLLGDLWFTNDSVDCSASIINPCPPVTPQTASVAAEPPLPDTDTPLGQASPAQRAAWTPYGVLSVPAATVPASIPQPPAVDNRTNGEVPDELAQRWALAVERDQAWLRWSWQALQLGFQQHLGDDSLLNTDLAGDAQAGGHPTLPDCAAYPQSLQLAQITPDQASTAGTTAHEVQYVFTVTFTQPCPVTVRMPDGSVVGVTLPQTLEEYGSLRVDPLLGEVWWPVKVRPPLS